MMLHLDTMVLSFISKHKQTAIGKQTLRNNICLPNIIVNRWHSHFTLNGIYIPFKAPNYNVFKHAMYEHESEFLTLLALWCIARQWERLVFCCYNAEF